MVRLRGWLLSALISCSIGRRVLAALTTVYARRRIGIDVTVFYDGVWGHLTGGVRIPDCMRYRYSGPLIDGWKNELVLWRQAAEEFWCWAYKLQPADTVLDIGAGVGSDVLFFSRSVGPTGKVLAVEANLNTHALLKKLCEWNNLRNVVCRQVAVVDRPSTVHIEDHEYHESNSLLPASGNGANGIQVQGVRLDDLIKEEGISRIDLLKMNIEGAELPAIKGMEKMLACTRHICVACHDFRADAGEGEHFRSRKQIEQALRDHGFQVLNRNPADGPSVKDHVHGIRRS